MCQICGQPDNIRCNCQVSQPFCDQCGNDNACEEKMDAQCVFYHLNCTDPAGLTNLGIPCNTDLETILEALDDLVGNSLNIPFSGTETATIRWVANGPAGHKPYAHVKISNFADNDVEVKADGLYVKGVKIVGSTNDCITLQFIKNTDTNTYTAIPYLNIGCLLEKIKLDYLSQFCEIVDLCTTPPILPTVTVDCDNVSIFESFVVGTPSVGSVTIPVTVVGSGTVTVVAQTLDGTVFGSLSTAITNLTTSINVPISYSGGGSNGVKNLQISFFGTSNSIPLCNKSFTVDNAPDCIPVAFEGETPLLFDAIVDNPYSASIFLSGTLPFSLTNIVKPAWMNIVVSGNEIIFSGTPTLGDVGENIVVSFTINNCEGSVLSTLNFSDTINVIDEVIPPPTGCKSYLLEAGPAGAVIEYRSCITNSLLTLTMGANVVKSKCARVGTVTLISGTCTITPGATCNYEG